VQKVPPHLHCGWPVSPATFAALRFQACNVTIEIPNYTLLRRLGEGAMAEVWLAEHQRNGRKAAIKVLNPSALGVQDAEALFLREGQVLASFDHPNIVKIYDNNRVGDVAFIIMEHLSGGTLQERMQRGSIKVGEALGLVVQIAGALEAAHKQNVIHRDLKPANVMLRDEITPVLTDFGAVRMLDRSTIYGRDGGIIGTPTYMSPEQITGKPLTGSSDLYALGIMFHELLTGSLPFPGGSIQEVASQHLYAEVPQLPESLLVLQPVLEQLLAKQPEWRYPSAAQFIDALRGTFLSSETLRHQVGFSGTSMAWSSQLRALGFIMDAAQKADVRRAQGEFLHAHTSPQPVPIAQKPKPRPEQNEAGPSREAPTKSSRVGLWLGLVAVTAALAGGAYWQWMPERTAIAALGPQAAPSTVVASTVIAARERYLGAAQLLQKLGEQEKREVQTGLSAALSMAKQGELAFDAGQLDEALAAYGQAAERLRAEGSALLDALEQEYSRAAQASLSGGRLAEAKQRLARAKQVRSQREAWSTTE
jgi:serine/threonine-protein kinase PpkA